jgi:inner membrane protein involved in colicin E2 resistance
VVLTDFPAVDFPPGSLSPSEHRAAGRGWRGVWRFEQIVGTAPVGIVLPERLNPGPLAARLTFFAPVSLLFFFFVTGMLLAARGRSIHPVNYFLLACAFFAFHLLFAYLIDHLAIAPSFALASLVSVGLVVTYARLFVGWRTALLQVGLSQLVYLVLFSVTFFWQGYTGLAITVGAIVTLFVMMQLTGRTDWERLARAPAQRADPVPPPFPP